MTRNHAVCAFAMVLALFAGPAAAAVFDVGDDGTVSRLDTPVAPAVAARAPHQGNAALAARAQSFRPAVEAAAQHYAVSPSLIDAIARVESRYQAAAVSRARAAGIMQLMPATAQAMGVDRTDPAANIRGGTAYLRLLLNRFDGDVVRTVAAYNAGPTAVVRAGGVPRIPETVAYVTAVMDQLAAAAQ